MSQLFERSPSRRRRLKPSFARRFVLGLILNDHVAAVHVINTFWVWDIDIRATLLRNQYTTFRPGREPGLSFAALLSSLRPRAAPELAPLFHLGLPVLLHCRAAALAACLGEKFPHRVSLLFPHVIECKT